MDSFVRDLCKEVSLLKERVKILENKKTENMENENKELKNNIEYLKKENLSLKEEIK